MLSPVKEEAGRGTWATRVRAGLQSGWGCGKTGNRETGEDAGKFRHEEGVGTAQAAGERKHWSLTPPAEPEARDGGRSKTLPNPPKPE